ncbi:MAG: cupin domain-containing protein [Rhodospirillaceae bacterium]
MRPHLSHVDGEALPWEEILNTGAERKQLSIDPDTGSDTSFVRIPKGWRGPAGAHYHSGFEEALILSGDVDLNGNDLLVEGSYLYRPGGIVHGWVDHSPSGSDIIIKMGRATDLISVGEPKHDHEYDYPGKRVDDGRPHIIHLKTNEQGWEHWPGAPEGVEKKRLSLDEFNGAETFLVRISPNYKDTLELDPSSTWEWIVLEGSISLADTTKFERLGYSHRPAGSEDTVITSSHGGCTMLMWSAPT